MMSKTPGSLVLSGAINGDSALTIRSDRLVADSRYAKIMQVMRASEQQRPHAACDQLALVHSDRRGDCTGGVGQAAMPRAFAVLVVATPCPLLIAIPVAILAFLSARARHHYQRPRYPRNN